MNPILEDSVYRMIHGSEDVYVDVDPEKHEKIIYGWDADCDIFRSLIEQTEPKYILDIGSWLGSSAIRMGEFIKSIGSNAKIVCVDTWLGSRDQIGKMNENKGKISYGMPTAYLHFLGNIKREGLSDVVIPFPQTSSNALRFLSEKNVKFQMVFVDGSNQYEDIKSDLDLSWNVLDDGGVLFGDDYMNFAFPQINAAVNSFVYGNRIRDLFSVDQNNVFWSIKKKGLI